MSRLAMSTFLTAVLTLSLLIPAAFAQTIPLDIPMGFPGLGAPGLSRVPVKCRPPAPAPCPPNSAACGPQMPYFNPYACPPPTCAPSPSAEPTIYVGYLFRNNGTYIDIQFNNGDFLGVTSTRNEFDLQGVWLEVAVPFALTGNWNGFVTGAHLFPTQTRSTQSYRLLTGPAGRTWNPDIQLWELNAGLGYRLSSSLSGIGGFRWNSLTVNFNDPRDQTGFTVTNDAAQLTANAYLPFLGVQLNTEPSCNSNISFAFLGFPAAPSDVDYQETLTTTGALPTRLSGKTDYKSGYFLEALAEASMKMNNWSLGGFARFDLLHTERTRNFSVAGASRQADITVERGYWILGGKVGVTF
jgi:hypothetical protein